MDVYANGPMDRLTMDWRAGQRISKETNWRTYNMVER